MRRHEIRQCALQALYQIDVGKSPVNEAVATVMAERDTVTGRDESYINQLVSGTVSHLQELDELLRENVEGWSLDRIARVEHNVLRMGLFELLYEVDVDISTIIDEAVELAKDFGAEESGKFVNGVLARLLPAAEKRRPDLSEH